MQVNEGDGRVSKWLNYHHLFYFKTIAEEGSVSKAAEKLRIGQPTLSAQLKQLEESIGLQLFERRQKKLFLTEYGAIALDYAKQIFTLGSEMWEVLHDRTKPRKAQVHIGALDSIPKQLMVSITEFVLGQVDCQITITEGKADELTRELLSHRMDLMMLDFLPSAIEAQDLQLREMGENQVHIFGHPSRSHLIDGFPKSVSGVPLVVPTYDSKLRFDLDHWARMNRVQLNVVIESLDIAVKKMLAISNVGLIATASHNVERQLSKTELVKIGSLEGVFERLYLFRAQRHVPNMTGALIFDSFPSL